jgi:hypothetical protein
MKMAKVIWNDYGPDAPIFSSGPQSFVPAPKPLPTRYFVYITDKLADEDNQTTEVREFATAEEAIADAQKIIDDQLIADFKKNPKDRPLVLLDGLLDFGFMPTVSACSGSIQFNARAYAERKCYELTGWPMPAKLCWGGTNLP